MTALADARARALVAGHDVDGVDGLRRTLFVEAGAGSGKTRALVDRVEALVLDGVDITTIAAITFTEKAAGELRHRLRQRFAADPGPDASPEAVRLRQRARDDLDAAPVGTLHSFASRLLSEHAVDAGLPPNVEVLDAVASEIDFEARWVRDRAAVLDDPELARFVLLADALGLPMAGGAGAVTLKSLMVAFTDNWDRLEDPASVAWSADELTLPTTDRLVAAFRDEASWFEEVRHTALDPEDKLAVYLRDEVLPYVSEIVATDTDTDLVRVLGRSDPTLKAGNKGRKGAWPEPPNTEVRDRIASLRQRREDLLGDIGTVVLRRLAIVFRELVIGAAREREQAGRLEFHDLLVLARRMLTGDAGTQIRTSLRQRYTHLLLDEFQDTDPIQLDLAQLLATPPDDPTAGPDDGRLFFVGDPKQSIYRFRRADIALYLAAADEHTGPDGPLELVTNFRSTPAVLGWVNAVFGDLIQRKEGQQPAYRPLVPAPDAVDAPVGPGVSVVGAAVLPDRWKALDLRRHEAAQVADAVHDALTTPWQVRTPGTQQWLDCRPDDVTILLPARTSLPLLEAALDVRGIPYRADTTSLVYATRAVRDLLMALRAAVDPSDQLAVVSALRSTVFGCGDDDLVRWRHEHAGSFDPTWPGGEDAPADDPVRHGLGQLAAWHADLPFTTPSRLLGRIVEEQRLSELGLLDRRPRDVWRRIRFVVDQARQWSENTDGTVAEYLAWARLQASDSVRVAESILPETDDVAVRIMTVHASKGLEFPVTVLSGMTTQMRRPPRGVQVLWPDEGPVALKAKGELRTPEFDALQPLDEQLDHEERLRLLYVACTRARDHLVVSLVRDEGNRSVPTSADALAVCLDLAQQVQRPPVDPDDPGAAYEPTASPTPSTFDLAAWERERAVLRRRLASPSGLSPSDVQRRMNAAVAIGDDDLAAGGEKDARDLELPPWLKGRYGTAFGRAVHGVLQTIDLSSGADLDAIVRSQSVAEGVVGREPEIAELVRAALGSEIVREAAASDRVWRETAVAAQIGEQVLEGFVDLLFRRGDRVVVIDHKTAGRIDDAELDRRVEHYAPQAGAYALALNEVTGLEVDEVVLLFLGDGRAVARTVPDLPGLVQRVREHVEASIVV